MKGLKERLQTAKNMHGLYFDFGVLAASLLLSALAFSQIYDATRPIPGVPAFTPRPALAVLILAAACAQIIGSILKAPGLRSRLYPNEDGLVLARIVKSWRLDLLLVLHFIVFFSLLALTTAAPGASQWLDSLQLSIVSKYLILGSTALPTFAVIYALAGPIFRPSPGMTVALEHVGNLCLIFSAVVLQAWVERAIAGLSRGGIEDMRAMGLGAAIGHFLVILPLFALFYLPPRILFLAEDQGHGRTWLQIVLVNFILVLRFYWHSWT